MEQVQRGARETGTFPTLADDRAVMRSDTPRTVNRAGEYSYRIVPPKEMLRYCDLAEEETPVDAYLVKGIEPVLVSGPAIVLRPFREGSR